ncbi:family 78 glycoside hydrolase catalytic domain [Microcoleus sp. ZQ-A2]|nr:family 78 glycoside hydrolase catalytic domain [Microcoleus sp. FACHB-1]
MQLTAGSFMGNIALSNQISQTLASINQKTHLTRPVEAKFIWYDAIGSGRNLYGLFRKSLQIQGKVKAAVFSVFADTAYQLFVNGEFVEFGPVRFDPRFPLYDTHDLSKYLQSGKNVIAVRVNYFGLKTYKSIPAQAGWIGWGTVESDASKPISLHTKEGLWRSKPDKARWRYASKTSFALNAADLFDQSHEEQNWKEIDFSDDHWPEAVELAKQETWGTLAPRSIPYMSGKIISIPAIALTLPLKKHEDWYSFSVPIPHYFEEYQAEFSNFIAYTTWIYSPVEQVITAGVFWGENWLNGKEIPRGIESVDKSLRINQRWELKAGWNHLFGKVGAYYDILHQYFALPQGKGLILSADKNPNSLYTFKHSPVLRAAEFEKHLKDKPLPYSSEETLAKIGGWVLVTKDENAHSPCRETSWDDYGEPIETLTPNTLQGHVFRLRDYPYGFSILMDMGHMHLGFPRLQLEGVRGAIIDLTYSEHLNPNKAYLGHTHFYSSGDRILCSREFVDWFPSHPRGIRYFKVTVRNITTDVTLKSISLRLANYPVKSKGWFRCSDPVLNEVWLMGQRTQAANMEDAYIDTPGRERGMYGWDTIIQYHVNLATFGDQALMQRCLELYGQSPDATGKFRAVYPNTGDYTIADFALNMVEGYRAYYEQTSDTHRIQIDWEAIMKNLQWFHDLADEHSELLLDAEWHTRQNVPAEYSFVGDPGTVKNYMDKTGIHCVFSCNYLIALQSAVILAQAIGKQEDAQVLQKRVDILSRTIPERFWNPKKECFSDNLKHTTHSAHASLFAVRAGVVNANQLPSVRKHVAHELRSLFVNGFDPSDGALVAPSFAFFILDGLYKAGLEEIAENMMRQGWGWVLAQGLKTCPEYFSISPKLSLCHAWSASPTYYLSKYILGVHFPKAPDLDIVEIRVQTQSITQAEGAFPHPKGLIEVKWHTENGKRIFDKVKAPEGVEIRLASS